MKKILVLGAPVFQIPVVLKAKQMGLYVGIVDINEEAPAIPFADEYFCGSIRSFDEIMDIAKVFKPHAILIGANDTSVKTAAMVCEKLNLPCISVEAAINSTDKLKMLEAFAKSNVPHPKYQFIKKNEIDNFTMMIPYPAIAKPVDSSGSRGINIIRNANELYNAIRLSSEAGISGDVLIEEYMTGPEVSVEVVVIDGIPHILQITDKITSGAPNFYETGHSQPSALDTKTKEAIEKVASQAVLAVGLINSPAHVEIKVTDEGPKMVELGARFGGGCITSYLIETSMTGVNMIELGIKLSLGEKIDLADYKNSGICSGVRFIPAKEGTIKSITGVSEAAGLDFVVDVRLTCKIGKKYSKKNDNSARFGYVVCKGTTNEEALNNCEKAISLINIEME